MAKPTVPSQFKFTLQQAEDQRIVHLQALVAYLVKLEARVKVLEAKP